jgi:hypothetical protein
MIRIECNFYEKVNKEVKNEGSLEDALIDRYVGLNEL